MTSEELKSIVINVNQTLRDFEAGYCSLKRSPYEYQEKIQTFEQYIECRLNFELFSLPELCEIVPYFKGHFLTVMSVSDIDNKKRRFSEVIAYINKSPDYFYGDTEEFMRYIEKAEEILGGSKIVFNYSLKKPKIFVEK